MTETHDVPPASAEDPANDERYLILMRHAKSDWGDSSLSDHDRPLNARGRRDAPRMAKWLNDVGIVPDRILSSTSERTRETVGLMTPEWNRQPSIEWEESLYLAAPDTILSSVGMRGGEAHHLMVVAHNPGMSYLASALAGESRDMPTAAIAIFKTTQVECDWAEMIAEPQFEFVQFMRPKAL